MEGRTDQHPDVLPAPLPLVGRQDALRALEDALDATAAGEFRFVALVGEPGAGKTRLLSELAGAASARKLPTRAGRAAEFEQEMPFGAVVDALDDHLEEHLPDLGPGATRLLSTVFPALAAAPAAGAADPAAESADGRRVARYQLYRTVRRLLEELAAASGLVLMLDDLHWADEATIELLDHLVRHPPRARVTIAVAYRPAQASPRLAALVEHAVRNARALRVPVEPLTEEEVAQLLGLRVPDARCRRLYQASGGNPFYLEALARSPRPPVTGPGDGDLPPAVQAALALELSGLSQTALRVAQGAAVAADEFDPALAAVAAEVSEDATLSALDELVARDIVRPKAERFRFRHPLVRHAAYGSAAAGWRLAAHGRIAAYLAKIGAPAAQRARHVERSGRVGDPAAIATLVEAARTFTGQAPVTAAHWLRAALRLMPENMAEPPEPADGGPPLPSRLDLLMELAQVESLGGRLAEGRETARTLLRLLPPDDYDRRATAARLCALMERLLGRPHEARALLLDELRRIPDPASPTGVPLRLRLVAESLFRGDFRAARAVLENMPENGGEGWPPAVRMAVTALRPMSSFLSGNLADALRHAETADRLVAEASDDELAEWLDAVAWLCWAEHMMGRYGASRRHFERAVSVARGTGQSYILATLLTGQARASTMEGRLTEAAMIAEEAVETARLLGAAPQLAGALTQQSLTIGLTGDAKEALRLAEEALRAGADGGEWYGAQAQYAKARALLDLSQVDAGVEAMMTACNGFGEVILLDYDTRLACCEIMAEVAAQRGRDEDAALWADRAERVADPQLDSDRARATLARSHARLSAAPEDAARLAREAAALFEACYARVDVGRARLAAGVAAARAKDRAAAREDLRAAAEIFAACGARLLHSKTMYEQRRLGVRTAGAGRGGSGRRGGEEQFGLSQREFEVAMLVADGLTNQQIAERLFISVRTVETHLSHIFSKLDITSRVNLVKALARLQVTAQDE
ncbi:UNVERIFIED_ORG: regulatory LuxR family protein [Actinomadura viridilutea]|nr:LuxR family transcriptional regulator [Actinomadura rubrobrunea]